MLFSILIEATFKGKNMLLMGSIYFPLIVAILGPGFLYVETFTTIQNFFLLYGSIPNILRVCVYLKMYFAFPYFGDCCFLPQIAPNLNIHQCFSVFSLLSKFTYPTIESSFSAGLRMTGNGALARKYITLVELNTLIEDSIDQIAQIAQPFTEKCKHLAKCANKERPRIMA